jgi:hypothetical protein
MAKVKPPEGCLATYKVPGGEPVYVDPEFKGLLDPLLPAELGQLEANLISDKRALEPIIIWQEARIIMDGMNRIGICTERKIPYQFAFLKFPLTPEGRTQALQWVIDHQTGRRNLSDEAKRKLIEWRRERVAAAHKAGDSNRKIADREGINESTVRDDIKATGAAMDSPDKIKGADDKEYSRKRAERVGQKPVPFVPKGERMPGDDSDQIKKDKEEARSDPKNGQVEFSWPAFNREFANFMLNVDKLGKVHKKNNSSEATKLRQDLLNWKNDFRKWGAAISKKEPVLDAVDKTRAGRKGKGK